MMIKSVDFHTFNQLAKSWGEQGLESYFCEGDKRLESLHFFPSKGALALWHFLLSEETRLHQARKEGKIIVGAMKDLGTIPLICYAFENVVTFYVDGAWWLPCFKAMNSSILDDATACGVGENICPARALLGAFKSQNFFPLPDYLICSTGATCDDFAVISQRLVEIGYPIDFWEIPHIRYAEKNEPFIVLNDGRCIPAYTLEIVSEQFKTIIKHLEALTGEKMNNTKLIKSITLANEIRTLISQISEQVYAKNRGCFGALETLIVQMLAIHFCSDRQRCKTILELILNELETTPPLNDKRPALFWVNPVADLRIMNLLESLGGLLGGSDFMMTHALSAIRTDLPPHEAIAQKALEDPMVCGTTMRVELILREIQRLHTQGVVMSRIEGASHSAWENQLLQNALSSKEIPHTEIEVTMLSDSASPAIATRLSALIESIKN